MVSIHLQISIAAADEEFRKGETVRWDDLSKTVLIAKSEREAIFINRADLIRLLWRKWFGLPLTFHL